MGVMLVAFFVAPSGGPSGESVAEAAAVRVVRASGVPHRTDAKLERRERHL